MIAIDLTFKIFIEYFFKKKESSQKSALNYILLSIYLL